MQQQGNGHIMKLTILIRKALLGDVASGCHTAIAKCESQKGGSAKNDASEYHQRDQDAGRSVTCSLHASVSRLAMPEAIGQRNLAIDLGETAPSFGAIDAPVRAISEDAGHGHHVV